MSKAEKPLSTLWGMFITNNTSKISLENITNKCDMFNSGCELNESNKEESFKTDDTNHQHQLALRTVGF